MAVTKDRVGGLWLVYGIPGTGKTLLGGIADGLIPAVRSGRRVFTNITGLSAAGISSVAGVPPLSVDVEYIEEMSDILTAFDSDRATGSLFILDEMRSVLGADEKNENWLSQRLNIMRKRGCDFIMIAQVSGYFSQDIRQLAKGCSLYMRLYSFGSKSKTREYRWNFGTPVLRNNKPVDYAGLSIRTLDSSLFTCYDSYIDSQIKGQEDSARTNLVWTSPKAFIAYAFILFVLLFVGFGVFFFLSVKDEFSSLGANLSGRPAVSRSSSSSLDSLNKAVTYGVSKKDSCYNYIICDESSCKTDIGIFPSGSYNRDFGGVVTPGGLLSLCGAD